jgi:hypothetical protein
MCFNKFKTIISTLITVYNLSLKNYKDEIYCAMTIWVALILFCYTFPPLQFFVEPSWKGFIWFIVPFILCLLYLIVYYFFIFKKIVVKERNYFLDVNEINGDFIKIPQLIIAEGLVSRFSFEIQLYGNVPSKFEDKKLFLVIRKSPALTVYLKKKNKSFNQEYFNPHDEVFYIEQDYERYSTTISFSVYIETIDATDSDGFQIFIGCDDFVDKFVKQIKNKEGVSEKGLIHSEELYMAK